MDEKQTALLLGMSILDDLSSYPLIKEKEILIPYSFAKEHGVLPLGQTEDSVQVAFSNPLYTNAAAKLQLLLQKKIEPFFCDKSHLEPAIEKIYQHKEEELFETTNFVKEEEAFKEQVEGYDLLETQSDNPVIRILNALLTEAITQKASDIHFEPVEKDLAVRFRIDGVLQKRRSPPQEYKAPILARIKVMASLDIAEQRLPQDGRIKLKLGNRQIDFRVSTLPVVYGERIVLRILDKGQVTLGLENVGMLPNTLDSFRSLSKLPEGILLVTGPTGSGKTTTLYSALSEIDSSSMNIMTIEDPVEYKLPNIAQIAVNNKIDLTFAAGLRHILRQDPDVVMIGEIRDKETAQIAIQASLTGHLVLSTLHTNDAPSALTRLADMGVEPYLLASSVIGVLAQRLVRRICEQCRTKYKPTKKEKELLGLEESSYLYKGKGCSSCFDTGYKGRIGIHELMEVNSKIKKQVVMSPDASLLKEIFLQSGGLDLRGNGIQLVTQGITTVAEILRMTRNTLEEE